MKILIVLGVFVILFVLRKKKGPSNDVSEKKMSYEEMRDAIGITLSPEKQKREDEKYNEVTEKTISDMESSGYFKPDCIPAIAKKIREKTDIGYRYYNPFDKKDCLTLQEKKDLGLNTREKYSRELINALTEKGLATENPNDLFQNIWQANFHKISRNYKLQELKDLGVQYVKIRTCEDERDCKAIKLCKKRWPIDEVPELPLPKCNAPYCRCDYAMADTIEDFKKKWKK